MTDKVQKIREEVERVKAVHSSVSLKNSKPDILAVQVCINLLSFIDSLQEEPVSEDLEKASRNYADNEEYGDDVYIAIEAAFKAGAQWQKANLWKPADGDDLPEIDREVIAILAYDFGHYKVVYAHRPNPNGWNGTNIDTGEEEHFEPEIYGKGGWNQPHVLYWLDTRLPYEENKIDK